jgi:2-deoxy-D-gluconate 3-dehydrogenase
MEFNMRDLFSVEGKIALVTGGSRGIGEMIAAGFLANGVKVYITSRKTDACNATAENLMKEYGGECISIPADLSKEEGIQFLVEEYSSIEQGLDILVNNAGASWGEPLEEYSPKGWDKVMDTNVKGVFFLTQKLLPLLKNNADYEDPSRVINIGSIDGIRGHSFDAHAYGPSKAALHHLTKEMASRLVRDDIIVNAIAPGPFPTWMLSTGVGGGGDIDIDWSIVSDANPRKRLGTKEDIAGLAIFLSSRAGAFTVGEVITCDGGVVVRVSNL